MSGEIHAHQIEELLLNAHLESEGGIDLIEEYFSMHRSLDRVTAYAKRLLEQESDVEIRQAIVKNLGECIVVKNQRDQFSIMGIARRFFQKRGIFFGKSGEIKRAELLVQDVLKSEKR